MKPAERYIDEVLRHVFAAPEDRERLAADLQSHFAEAASRGEPAARVIEAMGAPEDVAAAFNAEREIRYAGFWQRVVAFLGDCGALFALALPAVALAVMVQLRLPADEIPIASMAVLVLLGSAICGIFVFYFPLLEARFGKTLGKHWMRIRVVRESGAPIGLGQAFVRRLSLYFEMLVVDALFVPFTDRRQRALDIVAKTIVAREPGEKTPAWGWAACLLLPVAALLALAGVVALCAPS